MEVRFTPDLQARLAQRASRQGLAADAVVIEMVESCFREEDRFIEAVKLSEAALARGESLSHEEVGERLARFLRP